MRADPTPCKSPALAVACPKCDAPPGVHCRVEKRVGDRPYMRGSGHMARVYALREAERLAALTPTQRRQRRQRRAAADAYIERKREARRVQPREGERIVVLRVGAGRRRGYWDRLEAVRTAALEDDSLDVLTAEMPTLRIRLKAASDSDVLSGLQGLASACKAADCTCAVERGVDVPSMLVD